MFNEKQIYQKEIIGIIKRNSVWLAGGLIILLTFIVYLPAIGGGFIWLDDLDLTNNPLMTAPDGLRRIWVSGESYQYYPLSFTTFWILHKLWGFNPIGYHIVNIISHSIVALLFWYLLHYLRIPGALWAALIFSLHPIEVESVAWIAELKNTQSAIFFLASIISYLHFEDSKGTRWYWLALALFLAALLSKPSTIMLPVTLLLFRWWERRPWKWNVVLKLLPFFILSSLMAVVCIFYEKYQAGANGTEWSSELAEKIAISGRIVWFYLGKLIMPSDLVYIYPRWSIDPRTVISCLPIVTLLILMVILWWKRQSWGRPALMGLTFFVVNLFPVLGFFNIYYMRYSYVANRWQYLSSMGIIALVVGGVAGGFERWNRVQGTRSAKLSRTTGISLAVVILILLGIITFHQASLFRDKETLLRNTIKINVQDWTIFNRLGNVLTQDAKFEEAVLYYSRALELNPDDVGTINDLGNALAGQGKLDKAIAHYSQALQINPTFAEAHNNLGVALARQGKLDEAIAYYSEALRINPNYMDAKNNLKIALVKQANPEEPIIKYGKEVKSEPGFSQAYLDKGMFLTMEGKYHLAGSAFRSALELNPDDYRAHTNLGNLYYIQRKYSEAAREYKYSLAIKDSFNAHYNLGFLFLNKLQQPQEALTHLEKALDMVPNPLQKIKLKNAISQIEKE